MKNLKILTPLLLSVFLLAFGSCAPVDNADLNPVDKFICTWSVSDQGTRLNYQVVISANPLNSAEVLLSNFADLGNTAVGLVVENSVVLDNQSLGGNYTVSGSGSYISDTRLTFNYQLDDGIDSESRSATFSK